MSAITAAPAARPLAAWPRHAATLAILAGLILALFARDAAGMTAIWWGSSSYEHCLLILPVLAWLVWIRRGALAGVEPVGWPLPLAWVAAGALGWLLGAAAGVAAARHLGLVMMLQGAVAATIGPAATRILLFPLGYALFLVPLGDVLVPPLQTLTARMCMVLLHLARVPAAIDGVFIATPGGWFKVAEACSGAKFLIAMAALAVLVAHLGFQRARRQLAFLAMALAVPVAANGLRAFATIWVAQYRGVQAAAGFDHVVYGWLFFALVIAAVLALAWRFFDREPDAVPAPKAVAGSTMPLWSAAAATLLIASAPPAWAAIDRGRAAILAADPSMPAMAGWAPVSDARDGWRPRFDGADRLLVRRYRDGRGRGVDLAVVLYARQDAARELVGYGHGAADPEGRWNWAANEPAAAGWRGERIEGPGGAARVAWTRYVVGGRPIAGAARAKLMTLGVRLLGGDPLAGALILSAPATADGRLAVAAFAAALGDPVRAVDRAAGR